MSEPRDYWDWVAEIEAGVADVLADLGPDADVSEDEVFCDLAAAMLVDADRAVAREVCRVQLGFVPAGLLSHWQRQDTARARLAEHAGRGVPTR